MNLFRCSSHRSSELIFGLSKCSGDLNTTSLLPLFPTGMLSDSTPTILWNLSRNPPMWWLISGEEEHDSITSVVLEWEGPDMAWIRGASRTVVGTARGFGFINARIDASFFLFTSLSCFLCASRHGFFPQCCLFKFLTPPVLHWILVLQSGHIANPSLSIGIFW